MSSHRSGVPVTGAERVRDHRKRLRAQGLRPIQIWVPDVRSPTFVQQAHQQSLSVAVSAHAADDQAFIDAASLDDE
jgi:Protein  of unknown function (DUF3018)